MCSGHEPRKPRSEAGSVGSVCWRPAARPRRAATLSGKQPLVQWPQLCLRNKGGNGSNQSHSTARGNDGYRVVCFDSEEQCLDHTAQRDRSLRAHGQAQAGELHNVSNRCPSSLSRQSSTGIRRAAGPSRSSLAARPVCRRRSTAPCSKTPARTRSSTWLRLRASKPRDPAPLPSRLSNGIRAATGWRRT